MKKLTQQQQQQQQQKQQQQQQQWQQQQQQQQQREQKKQQQQQQQWEQQQLQQQQQQQREQQQQQWQKQQQQQQQQQLREQQQWQQQQQQQQEQVQQQQRQQPKKEVSFRTKFSEAYCNSKNRSDDFDGPYHGDGRHFEGVRTSLDLRSPSLHTIPISINQSHSDVSVTSPRSVRNSTEKLQKKIPSSHKCKQRSGMIALPTNTQVYGPNSSSSEEQSTAMKKQPRSRPDPPTSGRPSGIKESRIPRRTILRKQLGKNMHNKSESESDSKSSTVKRATASQSQVPNSTTRSRVKSAAHRAQLNRPSSTESQEDVTAHPPKRRPYTKAHSVPDSKKEMDRLPYVHVQPPSSPPVPAVAKRLAQERNAAAVSSNESNDTNVVYDAASKVQNYSEAYKHRRSTKQIQSHTPLPSISESAPKTDFKLPEIVAPNSSGSQTLNKGQQTFPPSLAVAAKQYIPKAPSEIGLLNNHTCSKSVYVSTEERPNLYTKNGVCLLPPIKESISGETRVSGFLLIHCTS